MTTTERLLLLLLAQAALAEISPDLKRQIGQCLHDIEGEAVKAAMADQPKLL